MFLKFIFMKNINFKNSPSNFNLYANILLMNYMYLSLIIIEYDDIILAILLIVYNIFVYIYNSYNFRSIFFKASFMFFVKQLENMEMMGSVLITQFLLKTGHVIYKIISHILYIMSHN